MPIKIPKHMGSLVASLDPFIGGGEHHTLCMYIIWVDFSVDYTPFFIRLATT